VFADRRIFDISKLAVEPSRRREGWGSRLMGKAETYANDEGWPATRIFVLNVRMELFAFYGSLGYVDTGSRKYRPNRRL
jgi:ribosomal protein S18 acetylase RimI-like enzyme